MTPAPSSSPPSQRPSRWSPWAPLVLLIFVFELPTLIRPDGFSPSFLRPTLDLVLLLWLGWWSRRRPHARAWTVLLVAWLVMLCVFRLDKMLFFLLMRQEPLLYDQLYMLRHAWVLLGDLWSTTMFLGVLAVLLGLVGLVLGSRYALRSFYGWVDDEAGPAPQPRARKFTLVSRALLALGLGLVLAQSWANAPSEARANKVETRAKPKAKAARPWVRVETPALIDNIRRSLGLYTRLKKGLRSSPYKEYAQLELTRKPEIRLYLVESYGAILATHPELSEWWRARVNGVEEDLAEDGWFAVSALVRAPVSGGRSWLAEASIVTGIRVRYEAEFHQVLNHIDESPNLVSFLAAQGYNTVSLSPADRPRAGVKEVNYYGYDQRITFPDLDYRAGHYGWGIVPDEYSLGRADDELINRDARPIFLNAHLVSSHAPWKRVPTFAGDWRKWVVKDGSATDPGDSLNERKGVLRSMRRFKRRDKTRFMYEGKLTNQKLTRFRTSINYELEVMQDRISALEGDALVIVMGDHQPPLVTPETANFAVPVHVFARDPALLKQLEAEGFTPGLSLPADAVPIAQHQGLLSLFVRNLVACCTEAGTPLPPLQSEGLAF